MKLIEFEKTRIRLVLFVISLFLLVPRYLAYSAAAPPATKIVITFANFGERAASLYVARDQGFFRKYDLDVQLIYVRSGPVALSALSGGYSHFDTSSASGATLGAIASGADVRFVAGLINKLTGAFVAAPEIKSPVELKGKRIGVTSIGGGNWMRTMLALDHWGLDPGRDGVTIRVIGDDTVRLQALGAGIIDGTLVDYAFTSSLNPRVYRVLADLAGLGIPYQGIGVLVRRSFANQSPDAVERVLKALVEAITFIQEPANKSSVMRILAMGSRLSQVEDAAEAYERLKTLHERRIYPNLDGMRNTIRLLGAVNEKIRQLKVEDVIDDRIVKKLEKEGRF